MNKILAVALAVLMSFFSARAQDDEKALVINAGSMKHLIFGENIKVVLLEHRNGLQDIKFSNAVQNQLKVSMQDGSMTISAQNSYKSEPVYVLVSDLQSLTLGENCRISTEGTLNSDKLDVFVEQGARAVLRTTGKVNANSLGDFYVSVERNAIGIARVF